MATIHDVAVKAGVSVATVSRLLNGTAYVSKETSDKVFDAIKELNYHPNRIAQTLNTKKSLNIAMVVNDISNPITATYVKGAETVSRECNYNFILCCTNFDIELEKKYINSLVEKQVDGIILSPCGVSDTHIEDAVSSGIPVVFITRRLPNIDADYIKFDDIDGGYKITKHLIDCGYKRICAIGRDVYDVNFKNRLAGYKRAMEEAGLEYSELDCSYGDASMSSGYNAMRLFCERNTAKPDAVYASTSMIAAGVIQYCNEKKIVIPGDIALASFESFMEFNGIITPRVTHYNVPIFQLGYTAAEALFDKIKTERSENKQIILGGNVEIGESTISAR